MGSRAEPLNAARRRWLAAAPGLAAGAVALGGCRPGGPPALDGGWVGSMPARGHAVRDAVARPAGRGPVSQCAVAVVGAGMAGLAAARALRRAGVDDLCVLELEDAAGGNARGHVLGGLACPLGAHYLPQPGPDAHEVAEWLHELGLLRSELGRTVADERHLCHSPQERIWFEGAWHEGLLPPAAPGSARLHQYRRFASAIEAQSRAGRYTLPARRGGWSAAQDALDRVPFAVWLDREGFTDPALRWYLDYVCRDDYGAGAGAVSAWAGVHYFACRHGFGATDTEAVFTWPEGNAWLVERLARPLGDRLVRAAPVVRLRAERHAVAIDLLDGRRWRAERVVVALPLHVARRVVAEPPPALEAAARAVVHAPWLVANLLLRSPLVDVPTGAAPAWDNVLVDLDGASPWALGYVDARHQELRQRRDGPALLTAYWALPPAARARLLDEPWSAWAGRIVDDLARAHPDLPRRLQRIELARHGHAMAVPVPGLQRHPALRALADGPHGRLHFAHSDLAGYSVIEEAFTLGDAAGRAAAAALARGTG
jgi:predicted NAD/FAD-dependent oxidoreductase